MMVGSTLGSPSEQTGARSKELEVDLKLAILAIRALDIKTILRP